jgi:hypothetical protein
MFCPVCKAEYRPGFTECSDCQVALVDALPVAAAEQTSQAPTDPNARELFWSGYDPRIFEQFQAALNAAGIQYAEHSQAVNLRYEAVRPMEIWTYVRDHDAADKVYRELTGVTDPQESDEEAEAAAAIPEEEEAPEEDSADVSAVPDDISEEIDSEEATAEVWSGEAAMLDILEACLRENGIASVRIAEGSSAKLFVLPHRADRAKEIIREVIDATPEE